MLGKLIAIWQAIRAGDWLTAFKLLLEMLEAQKNGQITEAEIAEVQKALPGC